MTENDEDNDRIDPDQFYDWQQEALEIIESDERPNVMVIAETQAGKSTLLEYIESTSNAVLVDGLENDPELLRDAFESKETEIVLLDEGGAFSHIDSLLELMRGYPNTQLIIGTLPACPSTMMVKQGFEVVHAGDE